MTEVELHNSQRTTLTAKQYEKLSDWGERFALALLASLVLQQIVTGFSLFSPSVIIGGLVTALAYYVAYRLLRLAR